jgi:3-deoxy-D-manno-octulosonic-acid transferase
MMFLYHILSTVLALFVAPSFLIYSLVTKSKRRGLMNHFGWVPSPPGASPKKTLWVFALSLGEVTAAAPVLKRIHEDQPDLRIVVSVTTDSGYDGALQKIPFADQIMFHPLDCLPFTLLALIRIRPDCFVVTDTGFWPGLLDLLARRQTPALLFNGRLSRRSQKRYQRLGSFSINLFNRFRVLGMQSEAGKNALHSLGVAPSRLKVIGDPKFDALVQVPEEERKKLRAELSLPDAGLIWIAGSTHRGEEEIILDVHQKLRKKFDDLILILAPRRLERVDSRMDSIEALLISRKISFTRRTRISEASENQVILLDTMGELGELYSIADLAFVGNSLLPPGGGHSLMEPLAQGVPVVHGPHVENFQQMAKELQQNELAFSVSDANEMTTVMTSLLENSATQATLSKKASSWIQSQQGASKRMADLILKTLPS